VKTIIVSGAIANKIYNGGAAWTRLSYVLGLRQLGFDVYFVEQIQPETCVDETGAAASFECSANVAYFRRIAKEFKLSNRMALIDASSLKTEGLSYPDLLDIASSADLLVNISGHLSVEQLKSGPRRRVYIDLDPGFTQFWHASGSQAARLAGHDEYFTVGENIGNADCSIPTGDIGWRPTRQPAVLDHWPVCSGGEPDRFTTIASWRGPYGPVEYQGRSFGSKVYQFRKYAGLPSRVSGTFEIALDIHPGDAKDREMLCRNSWKVADPRRCAGDPMAFQRYVQESSAEFSVAQQIYVDTKSGWFSDRTVRYLASGKPVLIEDTGFSARYPMGSGIVPFTSMAEAVSGAQRIQRDYATQSRCARRLAEAYFDSDTVLSQLLDEAGI
jgi:hypothetical protein